MPWSDRAKRLLGQGSGQKRDDPKKNAGRTSGGGKAGEIQVKKGVGTALRTSFVLDQRHQQAVRNEDRDVSESTEQKNTELQAPLTPILNISPGHGSATREEPNNLTESSRGLQKATPLGPTRERLWDEAYDILCEKEPKLMKAYERDLLSCQTQDEKDLAKEAKLGPEARIQSLLISKIEDVENAPLRILVGQKEIVVKKQIGRIVRGVLLAKDFIGSAISSEPHAALVWAGILVILPLLVNPITQDEDATDGLAYISELLHRCKVIEDTFINFSPEEEIDPSEALGGLKKAFATKLVQLYTQVFQYQIRLTQQFSRIGFFRYLRDVVIVDNWKTMLADVKKTEAIIRSDFDAIDSHTLSRMDKTLARLQKRADEMFDMQMKIKGQIETVAQNQLLQMLPRADAAAFDSFVEDRKRSKCLEGTRVEILKQIAEWGTGHGNQNIFWLNGLAGTGKSTIAQTIADVFSNTNFLGATFFFSRGKADRGDARVLFSTLALQLTESSPTFKIYIADAVKGNSSIGQKTLERQWKCLILHPLLKLDKHLLFPLVLVLVIDALDECSGDEDIRMILRLFTEVRNLTNIKIRVFITSRPETPIRLGFRDLPGVVHRSLVLQHAPRADTEHDIDIYLRHTLAKIGTEKSLGEDWPGDETIKILLQRADRLFIYAATVCSFLEQARFPQKRLKEMLSLTSMSKSTTKDLDLMYLLVLTTSMDNASEEDREDLSILFRQIVGSIICLYSTLSAASLIDILQVSSTEMSGALEGLHSVLDITGDPNSPIQLVHPSFRDFLLDGERCTDPRFLISGDQAREELFLRCLQVLSSPLKRNICNLKNEQIRIKDVSRSRVKGHILPSLHYAAQYWLPHLLSCTNVYPVLHDPILGKIRSFLETHFLHWLEVLSISQAGSEAITAIQVLWDRVNHLQPTGVQIMALTSLLADAKYFVAYFAALINQFPLQLYTSALIFSPRNSQVRRLFWKEVPGWIKQFPNVPEDWATIDGKVVLESDRRISSHGPTAMLFSPDMNILANAWGRQVDLWEMENRTFSGTIGKGTPFQSTLAFSPNSETLATVPINDNTIMLWNPKTRKLSVILEGHSAWIQDVVFTPDSKSLASASDDLTVRLWDVVTGKCYAVFEGHAGWVSTIAFSPDGRFLVSGSNDKTIRLWNVATGDRSQTPNWFRNTARGELQHTLKGHLGLINTIVFSPNGQVLASASFDHTIRLWDPHTAQFIGCLEGHRGSVSALVFSPNSKFIASLANTQEDATIRLWNIDSKETVQLIDSGGFLFQLSFSDDGSRLDTNRENLFWFPPGYAPRCVTFEKDVLAVGHSEGRVTVMEFFPGAIPLRQTIYSSPTELMAKASQDKKPSKEKGALTSKRRV